jgi:two-component system chemotaxis response regulator CheY
MLLVIADDSSVMRRIVSRTLRQVGLSNLEILEADNGAALVDLVLANQPDLVLSDWNMPEMSGIELLKALRAAGNPVRFGFVTSESTPAMRNTADENGAMFLIGKPFTAETFSTALADVLV